MPIFIKQTLWLLCLSVVSLQSFGQADFQIVSNNTDTSLIVNVGREGRVGFTVRNFGDMTSQSFQIRVRTSIDQTFDDDDVFSISEEFNGLEATTDQNRPLEVHELRIWFPSPTEEDPISPPRLTGDTLNPVQWVGRDFYAQGCIIEPDTNLEIECVTNSITVRPPRFLNVLGRLTDFATPFVANGTSDELLELSLIHI